LSDTVLEAVQASLLIAAGASGGGAGTAAVSGGFATSFVNNVTAAEIVAEGGDTVQTGSLALIASDDAMIYSFAGQATGPGRAAVGGGVAVSGIGNATRAGIVGVNVTATESVELAATTASLIRTAAASGAGAGTATVGGSRTTNLVLNATIAEV